MTTVFRLMVAYQKEDCSRKERYLSASSLRKRTARTVLTGMCYSVGSVMRQGSSSLTRLTGQS
ncbi:hypothetical protein, partial [Klebsiella pneumoniae]|uniref:hypothetical protein n=1 Tax=Klebsiella pneumoniae TaxID=573 RepID=UPI001E2CE65B